MRARPLLSRLAGAVAHRVPFVFLGVVAAVTLVFRLAFGDMNDAPTTDAGEHAPAFATTASLTADPRLTPPTITEPATKPRTTPTFETKARARSFDEESFDEDHGAEGRSRLPGRQTRPAPPRSRHLKAR